jgi:hypothetical protein
MFAVGLPIASAVLRGVRDDRRVQDMRDRVRHKIDRAVNNPVATQVVKLVPGGNKAHSIIKGVANRGMDDRHIIKEAREKAQFNKANSSFMDKPYENKHLSEPTRALRSFGF